ncbi:hypothetical protein CPB97_012118 [Podila verticillata]|nr:hypothetical protein CPB97_012118 [Podila verticillata]
MNKVWRQLQAIMSTRSEDYATALVTISRAEWVIAPGTNPAYGWIDTNNLVESLHYILEKHLFADRHSQKQQPLTTVICVLVNRAIPPLPEAV